jgi:hypothetical protein
MRGTCRSIREAGGGKWQAKVGKVQQEDSMDAAKIIAIVLIVAGALGLVYQQFSYTKETTQAKIGPLELSVKQKETVNIPLWISLGAIGVGVVLLVAGRKK